MFVKLLTKQAMFIGLMLSLVSSVSGGGCPIMFLDGFEGSLGGGGGTSAADENGTLTTASIQLCGDVYDDGGGGPLGAGTYLVTCDVVVPQGQTLTIQAGARIYFRSGFRIIASGTLFADADSIGPIYLVSNVAPYRGVKLTAQLRMQNGGELKPGSQKKKGSELKFIIDQGPR
jgi:hypothetical protein